MGAGDVLSDGEAESAGESAGVEEGLEEVRKIFRGDRRGCVLDLELDAMAIVGIGAQENGMVGGGGIEGEGEEMGEGEMDLGLVDKGGEAGRSGEDELESARRGLLLGAGGDGAKGVRDIDPGAREVERVSKEHEIGSEPCEAGRFAQERVTEGSLLGGRERFLSGGGQRTGDGIERIAKLIGDGGGETANDGELFLGEKMHAGTAELFEAVSEEEFLAA